MDRSEMVSALEAILFAAGAPVSVSEIKKTFERFWAEEPAENLDGLKAELDAALGELRARWQDSSRGFTLLEVAEGLCFRTNPRFAEVLLAMHEQRPVRLSRAALETLAIIAYRQPVTKPDIDEIRGVDCGATMRLLLDRNLIRIVGKKEEPGRPLLYGTSREFLSFFNITNLAQLPTLREFSELSEESQEEVKALDGKLGFEELTQKAQKIGLEEEPAVHDLDDAVAALKTTEDGAREALASEGIALEEEKPEPAPVEQAVEAAADADRDKDEPLVGA